MKLKECKKCSFLYEGHSNQWYCNKRKKRIDEIQRCVKAIKQIKKKIIRQRVLNVAKDIERFIIHLNHFL